MWAAGPRGGARRGGAGLCSRADGGGPGETKALGPPSLPLPGRRPLGARGGLQPSPQLRVAAAGEAGGVGGRAALGWAGEGCGEQAQRRPLAAKGTVSQTWRWRRPTGLLLLS